MLEDEFEVATNLSPNAINQMDEVGVKAWNVWLQALTELKPTRQAKQVVTIMDRKIAETLIEHGLLMPYLHKKVKVPGKYLVPRAAAFLSYEPRIRPRKPTTEKSDG